MTLNASEGDRCSDRTLGFRNAREWLLPPGSGPIGQRRWRNVRDAWKRLRDFPYLGPPSTEHPGCRHLIREGYRIGYQVYPDTGDNTSAGDVTILAVFPPGIGVRELT